MTKVAGKWSVRMIDFDGVLNLKTHNIINDAFDFWQGLE